jgi:transposase InsO family protein
MHHSDRGVQYVSIRYTERLLEAGIEPSVGSVGDSYDCEFMVLPGELDPSLRLTPCPCVDLSARRAAPADPRTVAS